MSKATSDKWQRRLFIAKDGFLLYYSGTAAISTTHFDTKPKGCIPLGGCKVDLIERGPKAFKYGLRITHPDFFAGRMLILAAETAEEQRAWLETLNDCSQVTMENAKLGDAMVEKLRAAGTAAEKEKADAFEKLQAQAVALKKEHEELLKLAAESETLKTAAVEAEERAKKKEDDLAVMMAEVERRKAEVDASAAEMQRAIEERAAALAASSAEYAKVTAAIASGGDATLQEKARALEEEKLRLEHEKFALEKSVRDLTASTQTLKSSLDSAESQRLHMETKLRTLQSEEGELSQERALRKRLERKLQIAEDSLKRLDSALRRSGVKLDVDVFADVKTLLSFFEERVEEAKRDAQRIDIMKKALTAKRKYLLASAKADTGADSGTIAALEAGPTDDTWDDDAAETAAAPAPTIATSSVVSTASISASPSNPAPAPPAVPAVAAAVDDEWGDEDSEGPAGDSDGDAPVAKPSGKAPAAGGEGVVAGSHVDGEGALPPHWTVQVDEEGDVWYYNEATQQTSWYRPNPDGTVPEA